MKPNQAIPRGLHVRLNMQTGEKEAKLMDDDPNGEKMKSLNKDIFKEAEKSLEFNYEELKKALKDLKDNKKFGNLADLNINEEQSEENNENNFKSYEELKKDFEALNMNVKTDTEILLELIAKYNKSESKAEKLLLLADFEILVHQIDNAMIFCDNHGFKMLLSDLNSTLHDAELHTEVALVLGAAIQGYFIILNNFI